MDNDFEDLQWIDTRQKYSRDIAQISLAHRRVAEENPGLRGVPVTVPRPAPYPRRCMKKYQDQTPYSSGTRGVGSPVFDGEIRAERHPMESTVKGYNCTCLPKDAAAANRKMYQMRVQQLAEETARRKRLEALRQEQLQRLNKERERRREVLSRQMNERLKRQEINDRLRRQQAQIRNLQEQRTKGPIDECICDSSYRKQEGSAMLEDLEVTTTEADIADLSGIKHMQATYDKINASRIQRKQQMAAGVSSRASTLSEEVNVETLDPIISRLKPHRFPPKPRAAQLLQESQMIQEDLEHQRPPPEFSQDLDAENEESECPCWPLIIPHPAPVVRPTPPTTLEAHLPKVKPPVVVHQTCVKPRPVPPPKPYSPPHRPKPPKSDAHAQTPTRHPQQDFQQQHTTVIVPKPKPEPESVFLKPIRPPQDHVLPPPVPVPVPPPPVPQPPGKMYFRGMYAGKEKPTQSKTVDLDNISILSAADPNLKKVKAVVGEKPMYFQGFQASSSFEEPQAKVTVKRT